MHTWLVVLLVSVWWCPLIVEAGAVGTTGPQVPGQPQIITKENFKLIQERVVSQFEAGRPVSAPVKSQTETLPKSAYRPKGWTPARATAS